MFKQFGMSSRVMAELPQSPASLFPEQVDEAASHTRPVLIVHPDEPHIQVALLGAFPLIWVHSSADRQRQGSEEEQEYVEEEYLL